jgi:hypothetical protein
MVVRELAAGLGWTRAIVYGGLFFGLPSTGLAVLVAAGGGPALRSSSNAV